MFRTTKVGNLLWVPINPNFTDVLKGVPYDSLRYRMGWIHYMEELDLTMGFVEDAFAFVRTIRNFTIYIIPGLMKTDLLRGMMKGHFPRRCEHCGRYFLMTKGYRTKFCDMPSPEDPNRTCNQISYVKKRVKEENANNPKYQSYKRCVNRIYKATERGTVTEKQTELLLSEAEKLYTTAMMSPEYSNEEFEAMLQSENLYMSCGIDIPSKGRPKKGTGND